MDNWLVMGDKVQGHAHRLREQPCQDAVRFEVAAEYTVLAVADGHGSAKCPFSEDGARLAVEVATAYLAEHALHFHESAVYKFTEKMMEKFPHELVQRWRLAVLELHERLGRERGVEASDDEVVFWYGATLLAVLVTSELVVMLQLGDGDLLLLMQDGAVVRPFEKDARLIGNHTTSLCNKDAAGHMRVSVQPNVADAMPRLYLLSTDGYSNSYRSDADFEQVAVDYWQMLVEHGFALVEENLASFMEETSRTGSGDDISVGLVVNRAAWTAAMATSSVKEENDESDAE